MDKLRFYELAKLGDPDDDDQPILDNLVEDVVDERWRLLEGEPMGKLWPEDARIYLSSKESGSELGEYVANTESVLLAGKRFVAMIKKHCKDVPIEYLPVAIYDHRKRLISDEYCVVNPLGAHDCIDLKRSDTLFDDDDPKEVLSVDDIVIDKKRGAKAPNLFRPEHARTTYIMRYDLIDEIADADLPNVLWTKLDVSG